MARPTVENTIPTNRDGTRERNLELAVRSSANDTFRCRWINRLDQFGSVSMDLIVEHIQGSLSRERHSFNWAVPPATVDSAFLSNIAVSTVERIAAEGGR